MKFTFKKHKQETGLRSIGHPYPDVDIKLKGQKVGWIYGPNYQSKDRKFGIYIRVAGNKSNPNSAWRNAPVVSKFDSEELARTWVKEHLEAALLKNGLELYPETD